MYARQNIQPRELKIPENYSGHAFSQSGSINDMPPPLRQPTPRPLSVKQPPTVSDIPPSEREEISDIGEDYTENMPESEEEQDYESVFREQEPTRHENAGQFVPVNATVRDEDRRPSIFSTLLPQSGSFSGKFPFGHGLGSEELLILAVMLLVYLSGSEDGKTDYEFMILLGLLLFAG